MKKKNKKKRAPSGWKTSGVLTSERRPHGEVVVVYPQELLGFSHGGFGHVGAAFVNGPAGTETGAEGGRGQPRRT